LIWAKHLRELQEIVEECGGGSFAVSVFLRADGFLIQPNTFFFDRLARSGRLSRFCELLKENFEEAVNDAEKESKRIAFAGNFPGEDSMPCVQIGDKRGRGDTTRALELLGRFNRD
jgi:hypothetical protein